MPARRYFKRPPIVFALAPKLVKIVVKPGSDIQVTGAPQTGPMPEGEIAAVTYSKTVTPASYALYEDQMDKWRKKVGDLVAGSVTELMIPVREVDLQDPSRWKTKPIMGLPGWVYVYIPDDETIAALVDELVSETIDRTFVPPTEPSWFEKQLPAFVPEPRQRFDRLALEQTASAAKVVGVKPATLRRRLRSGASLKKYEEASDTAAPPVALKALNRKIPLDELLGTTRMSKRTNKKITKLADSLGVSRDYLVKVARGQRTSRRLGSK